MEQHKPDGGAAMTDAEREAQIRAWDAASNITLTDDSPYLKNSIQAQRRILICLLDEARAKIARMSAPQTWDATGSSDRPVTERAPPEADVMKRAGGVFDEVVALLFDGTRPKPYLRPDAIIPIAAYGDRRAREAHDIYLTVCKEKVAEARAAALEEAAQVIIQSGRPDHPGFIDAIRALAPIPPQSEGGDNN